MFVLAAASNSPAKPAGVVLVPLRSLSNVIDCVSYAWAVSVESVPLVFSAHALRLHTPGVVPTVIARL